MDSLNIVCEQLCELGDYGEDHPVILAFKAEASTKKTDAEIEEYIASIKEMMAKIRIIQPKMPKIVEVKE